MSLIDRGGIMATKMQLDLDKIEDFASCILTWKQVAHNLGGQAQKLLDVVLKKEQRLKLSTPIL